MPRRFGHIFGREGQRCRQVFPKCGFTADRFVFASGLDGDGLARVNVMIKPAPFARLAPNHRRLLLVGFARR